MEELQPANSRKRKIENAPARRAKRINGETYIQNNETKIWSGTEWHCVHNQRKERCAACGGSELCSHNRIKYVCKLCGGSDVCSHGRLKSSCRDCNGSTFCLHNKRKTRCVACCGSQVCSHNKQKAECRQCGGSAFCEHGTRKSHCKSCCGSLICKHDRPKPHCYICSPDSKRFCTHCKHARVTNPHFEGHCFACYCQLNPDKKLPRRFMLKENHVHDYLREQFPDVNLVHGQATQCDEFKRRPDWVIDCFKYVVVIECDEDCHRSYDTQCETKRMMEILLDFNKRPVVFIRFNPDRFEGDSCFSFDEKNKLVVNDTWHTRKIDLKNAIQKHLDTAPQKECTVEFLFYAETAQKS